MSVTGSYDEYFGNRTWRVITEATGTDEKNGVVTTFTKGKFSIDGGVFHSPLSSARGTKGAFLQEVDAEGCDIPGSRIAVGVVVLRKARKEGAVK